MRTLALWTAALALVVGAAASPQDVKDADLARGIRLVHEGDFEAAVLQLDAAARRLETDPRARKQTATAYVYLGVAYLELNQEVTARGKFREALERDPKRRLDPREFSPQAIRVFELAREAARAEAAPPASPPHAPRPAPSPRAKHHLTPWILGGGAAVAGAVVLAGSGGGGATSNPTPTPTPTPAPQPTPTPEPTPDRCDYQLVPPHQTFSAQGGNGSCTLKAFVSTCPWSVNTTDPSWLKIIGAKSGFGNGTVSFKVLQNRDARARSARIRMDSDPSVNCVIDQEAGSKGLGLDAASFAWTSLLRVPSGLGELSLDGVGQGAGFRSSRAGAVGSGAGAHVIEARLVEGRGETGTWRFELRGVVAGSLQPLAGDVALLTADSVVFRLSGQAGEHVAFRFRVADH